MFILKLAQVSGTNKLLLGEVCVTDMLIQNPRTVKLMGLKFFADHGLILKY